ncbi:MBL fold metallo-hydrolase [Rhodococcus sp. C26F]
MSTLTLDVYTSPQRELPGGGWFSPTTTTLIVGPTEAILVDTGYTLDDVQEIARRIDEFGRALTMIYITHAHADHYFGLQWLQDRYPHARAVATPAVAEAIRSGLDAHREQWQSMFGDSALDNTAVPDTLDGPVLRVDDEEVRILAVGQGDIAHNTAVYIPTLEAVIVGDIAYNGINPFLAASDPHEWPQWIASLDAISELKPRIVVAGHKRPDLPNDDVTAQIGGTRSYIREFSEAVDRCDSARDVVMHMNSLFPEHGNPSALISSAKAAIKRKKHIHA